MQLTVFDLDHTILSVNGSYEFGSYLYQRSLIPFSDMIYCLYCYALHKAGVFSMQQLHQKTFNRLFKGKSLAVLNNHLNSFLDLQLSQMIYLPAIEHLKHAQQQGRYVVILSSSPDFIVGPIAERLGVSHWESTRYSVDKNNFLCEITQVMQGSNKANYLVTLASKLNILKDHTCVYTDSYLDLPLLEVAGKVVGVNPDRKLKSLCLQKGWSTI